ncbi:unnamed protein product [Alopecurus aequalis]
MDIMGSPFPLFFVPPLAGSIFRAHRRFLASVIPSTPHGFLDYVDVLAAPDGLLLVRLQRGVFDESVHMAVCDLLAGTWNVLAPLECTVNRLSCAIVTDEDCFPSTFFKVLAIVLNSYKMDDDQECNLYTFSSAKPHWTAPTKCFDKMWQIHKPGFIFPPYNNVALCRGIAHWFFAYSDVYPHRYYTYEVSVETCHASLVELSIPADQLAKALYPGWNTLSVTNEGSLSLLCMYQEGIFRRIDVWKRGDDIDSRAWTRTKVVELKPPRPGWDHRFIRMWSGKKSGILLIMDNCWCVHRVNFETGAMEEEKFRNGLGLRRPVPMEIDLSALFTSRLG